MTTKQLQDEYDRIWGQFKEDKDIKRLKEQGRVIREGIRLASLHEKMAAALTAQEGSYRERAKEMGLL